MMEGQVKETIVDTLYNDLVDSIKKKEIELGHTVENFITAGVHHMVIKRMIEQYIHLSYGDDVNKLLTFVLGREVGRMGAKMILGGSMEYSDIIKKELLNTLAIFAIRYFVGNYWR